MCDEYKNDDEAALLEFVFQNLSIEYLSTTTDKTLSDDRDGRWWTAASAANDAFFPISGVTDDHSLCVHHQRLRVPLQRNLAIVFVFHVVFDTSFDARQRLSRTVLQNFHVRVHARVVFSSVGEHVRVYSDRCVRVGDEVGEREFRLTRFLVYDFMRDDARVVSERDVVPVRNERVSKRMRGWFFGRHFQFSCFRYRVLEY